MKKLICTRGVVASGKSTWASRQKEAYVLNKDVIRDKLHNGIYSKGNEKIVIEREREEAERLIKKEEVSTIIIDNTHLGVNNKHIAFYRNLAENYGYKFSIKDFYISREEAIKRDREREKSVGIDVINKMFKIQGNGGYPLNPTFREYKGNLPAAYIVDIDGTLAFMDDKRSPYEYDKVEGDRVNIYLKYMLEKLSEDNMIFIVSGREDGCKKETEDWLIKNDIQYDKILMRKSGDKRKDTIVKKEIFDKYIEGMYNVMGVFDDRESVVNMWRLDLHLPTFAVWYGLF